MSTTLDASSTKIKPTASPNESSALKLNYLQVSEKKNPKLSVEFYIGPTPAG